MVDQFMRCSLIRVGSVNLMVLLICSLGVRMRIKFSVLATCVLSCFEAGKLERNLVKMLRMCLEGTSRAKSRVRLTATSREILSASILNKALVTALAMFAGTASILSIPFHFKQNSLNLVGIFYASSFTYSSNNRLESSLRMRLRQKLTTRASQKLNISSITSIYLVPLPKIWVTYYQEVLYLRILIARNLRMMRWLRYSRFQRLRSQRTKMRPIQECWSISVIFQMMLRMVQKSFLSLSIPIRIFSRFSLRKFLGYCAALCSHSMISCQIGLPNLTTCMMKLSTAFVLLVITNDIVYNFLFASISAIPKANSQCYSLFSMILNKTAKVSSRLILISASRSAWFGFLGKLLEKIVKRSLKYLSSLAFSQSLLMSMSIGCLMTGNASIFLAMTFKSLSCSSMPTNLAIIFSSIQPYMSLFLLQYSRFSIALQQFITSFTLVSKSIPLKISPYSQTLISSFRYSFISISKSRSSCDK